MKEFKRGKWVMTLSGKQKGENAIMLHSGEVIECERPNVGALIVLSDDELFIFMDISDGTIYLYDEMTSKWQRYEAK